MIPESEKYKRVITILRKSRPHLTSTVDIEKEVIKRISKVSNPKHYLSDIIDFIFGWVYIDWVRRSLITASVLLVMVFVWQQSIILKQINILSRQTTILEGETSSESIDNIEKMLMKYTNLERKFHSKTITISEKEMKELLESVNETQMKYKDLETLINSDPELKKYIEKKLEENSRTKIKL